MFIIVNYCLALFNALRVGRRGNPNGDVILHPIRQKLICTFHRYLTCHNESKSISIKMSLRALASLDANAISKSILA